MLFLLCAKLGMDSPKLMGLRIIQKGFSVKEGIFSENARHFDVKYYATFEPGGNERRSKVIPLYQVLHIF